MRVLHVTYGVLFDSLAGLLFDSLAGLHRNYLLDNIYQKGEVKLSDMRLRWMFDENFVESLLLRLGHRPSRPVTIQSAANKRGHVKTNLRARAYRPISFGSFISDLVRLQQTNKSRITRCLRSAYAAAPIKSGTRISRVAFTCQRHHQASPNGQDAIGGIATSSRSLRGSACTRCTDGGPGSCEGARQPPVRCNHDEEILPEHCACRRRLCSQAVRFLLWCAHDGQFHLSPCAGGCGAIPWVGRQGSDPNAEWMSGNFDPRYMERKNFCADRMKSISTRKMTMTRSCLKSSRQAQPTQAREVEWLRG